LGGFYECASFNVASLQDNSLLLYQNISPAAQARKLAYQLFNSLLPILFHSSIWNLPTSVDEARLAGFLENKGISEAECTNYFSHSKRRSQKASHCHEGEGMRGAFIPEVSSRALHGNATLISEVISTELFLMPSIHLSVDS
jgi:hypothetical protein